MVQENMPAASTMKVVPCLAKALPYLQRKDINWLRVLGTTELAQID
jgi:hypothetical protein